MFESKTFLLYSFSDNTIGNRQKHSSIIKIAIDWSLLLINDYECVHFIDIYFRFYNTASCVDYVLLLCFLNIFGHTENMKI